MQDPSTQRPPLLGPRERALMLCCFGFLLLIYLPFTGNYGLWDPWETHYGEVARQMASRNDWISLWWPGSPQDQATFYSKPVLSFWVMALSLKLFGLGHGEAAYAGEMALGWRGEWALRLPFVILGLVSIAALYYLVRRTIGRVAALWSAAILATSTQWALISRQAMTDMVFVAPMTVGLCFAGLALLLPEDELYEELPRRQRRVGGLVLSWPHHRLFYGVLALYVTCVLPQLVIDCVQLQSWSFYVFGRGYRTHGFIAMLPWVGLFLFSLPWMAQARNRRSLYLFVPFIMGGLATLAKGPAGIAMPALVILIYVVLSGRFSEVLGRRLLAPRPFWSGLPGPLRYLGLYEGGLEILRGSLIFLCVGAPWYAAMLVRHGAPFWMEFIGDNYVNRAQGRHGDRGTFEYYLRQIGAGMFPWSGVVLAGGLSAARWLRDRSHSAQRRLVLFALAWFLVDFMVLSLVNTKFHHYILPALPALAVLGGLLLQELSAPASADETRPRAAALLLLGLPFLWLSGRDLANFPARIGWLFNYDYVNVPVSGRPWPLVSIYGERYEYQAVVRLFAALGTGLTLLLGALSLRPAARRGEATPIPVEGPVALGRWLVGGGLLLALLVAASAVAPSPELVSQWSSSKLPQGTVLPSRLRWGWLLPALLSAGWLLVSLRLLARRGYLGRLASPALGGLLLLLLGGAWNCWVLDRFMVDISPHWSQKHVFATYFKMRKGPEEPVIAYQMYWRGENLYTSNQIYDHRLSPDEKTVFLQDKAGEKMQAYLKAHRGRRVFFLLERHRLETVRSLLPEGTRQSLQVVDDSNNKVYMAVAQL